MVINEIASGNRAARRLDAQHNRFDAVVVANLLDLPADILFFTGDRSFYGQNGHLVTRAAIERKESRGAQFREDYPKKEAAYGTFNYVTSKGPDGQMQIRKETIRELPAELAQVIKENE